MKSRARQTLMQPRIFRFRTRRSSGESFGEVRAFSCFAAGEILSSAPLRIQIFPPPAFVDTSTDAIEVLVSITSTSLSPVVKLFHIEEAEYKATALDDDHSDQAAFLSN